MNKILASLFGLGLIALSASAQAQMVNAQTGTTYTFVNADCDPGARKVVTFSNASPVAVTLPQAGASGSFLGGCVVTAVNLGAGTVTVTPTTSTVNGAATLVLAQYASAQIYNDSTPASGGTGNYIAATGQNSAAPIATTSITGTDSNLDINGLAAAQGGTITVTGGTSSTSANAGGPVTIVGGTPGATGIGGAATVTGGAGLGGAAGGAATVTAGAGQGTGAGAIAGLVGGASGAGATGNGGVARVVGGAATSTAGTGGAAQLTGGLGTTTGAGGAVTIAGGAGGNAATGGAVSISAGAATAANGAPVTITSGGGNAGTASGGDIALVAGAAVSTGTPGLVKVNTDANLVYGTYYFTGTPAATDQVFFLATRPLLVVSCSEIHSTAAGGASTMTVIHDTSTNAPGAGTSIHGSGSFNLAATANTVQTATVTSTIATAKLAAGDRLAVKFANAIQSSAGIVVSCGMAPV